MISRSTMCLHKLINIIFRFRIIIQCKLPTIIDSYTNFISRKELTKPCFLHRNFGIAEFELCNDLLRESIEFLFKEFFVFFHYYIKI